MVFSSIRWNSWQIMWIEEISPDSDVRGLISNIKNQLSICPFSCVCLSFPDKFAQPEVIKKTIDIVNRILKKRGRRVFVLETDPFVEAEIKDICTALGILVITAIDQIECGEVFGY